MNVMDRRTFLRGAGVAVSLPLLDAMRPVRGAEPAVPADRRCMVLIDFGFGFYAPNLFPRQAGREYENTLYLEPLQDFRDQYTLISGMSHPGVDGGHAAVKSILTGAPKPNSAGFRNTISLDQLAAEQIGRETRFSSLALGLGRSGGISVTRSGQENMAEYRPSRVFARLFLDGDSEEKKRQMQRLKEGQSVLDAVLLPAQSMQARLGSQDRHVMDQYFTAVRVMEQRLIKSSAWDQKPKPAVHVKPPVDIANNADLINKTRLLFDLAHLALATDSTRLITMHIAGINAVPPLAGVTQDYHNLSHHGQDPERLAELKIIELAQLQLFAEFLGRLRGTNEGDDTLLGRSMVLLVSELGNASSHDNRNLPVILAGGGFRHGQHLIFDAQNNYPLCNLFVTMLQRLGLEIDRFGSSTGSMFEWL